MCQVFLCAHCTADLYCKFLRSKRIHTSAQIERPIEIESTLALKNDKLYEAPLTLTTLKAPQSVSLSAAFCCKQRFIAISSECVPCKCQAEKIDTMLQKTAKQ